MAAGFQRNNYDHSVFIRLSSSGSMVLAVYVDDILLTGSDVSDIVEVKEYLRKYFVTKDMGRPRYFLGIEIAHSRHGVSLSQQKYAFDLLKENGLLGYKPRNTPTDADIALWDESGSDFEDVAKYRRLISRLIYLTVIRPDIMFIVRLESQFMHTPKEVHWLLCGFWPTSRSYEEKACDTNRMGN